MVLRPWDEKQDRVCDDIVLVGDSDKAGILRPDRRDLVT
jgi:hypothetical protein